MYLPRMRVEYIYRFEPNIKDVDDFKGEKYIARHSPQVISSHCPLSRLALPSSNSNDDAFKVQRYQEIWGATFSGQSFPAVHPIFQDLIYSLPQPWDQETSRSWIFCIFCICSTLRIKSWTCFVNAICPPVSSNKHCKKGRKPFLNPKHALNW